MSRPSRWGFLPVSALPETVYLERAHCWPPSHFLHMCLFSFYLGFFYYYYFNHFTPFFLAIFAFFFSSANLLLLSVFMFSANLTSEFVHAVRVTADNRVTLCDNIHALPVLHGGHTTKGHSLGV